VKKLSFLLSAERKKKGKTWRAIQKVHGAFKKNRKLLNCVFKVA